LSLPSHNLLLGYYCHKVQDPCIRGDSMLHPCIHRSHIFTDSHSGQYSELQPLTMDTLHSLMAGSVMGVDYGLGAPQSQQQLQQQQPQEEVDVVTHEDPMVSEVARVTLVCGEYQIRKIHEVTGRELNSSLVYQYSGVLCILDSVAGPMSWSGYRVQGPTFRAALVPLAEARSPLPPNDQFSPGG
jgi:hypothetical protein